MSVSGQGFDLLYARRFVGENWKIFGYTLIVLLALTAFITRPGSLPDQLQNMTGQYRSSGSLLVLPPNKAAILKIFGSNFGSDLEVWLSDAEVFLRFVEAQQIHDKVATELLAKNKRLAGFSRAIVILPKFGDALMERVKASDYVSFEDVVSPFPVNERVSRIAITTVASSPEDAQLLTKTAMEVLQRSLFEVAVARVKARRSLIEKYVRLGQKRVSRGRLVLAKMFGQAYRQDSSIYLAAAAPLRDVCKELASEVATLEWQIDMAARNSSVLLDPSGGLSSLVQERSREKIVAEHLYAPDSLSLKVVQNRYNSVQTANQELQHEWLEKMVQSLHVKLNAKRRLLQQSEAELKVELRYQLTPKAKEDQDVAERELSSWEAELAGWENKLVQISIDEQFCQENGTAVILQPPLPGRRIQVDLSYFQLRYGKTLKYFPLSVLAALLVVLLVHVWRDYSQVCRRQEHFFDAPVLVELPPLPRARRRPWATRKSTGSGN